jgi:anaerobic magnesium-protoporphyrin IX monomethyl ester cyclase
MRILFTHSYFLQFDPKQWETMQPYAPLGTIYAAALLRDNGFEVALHDVMFLNDPNTISSVLASFKPDVLVVYDDGFNYLTKMCLTNMRQAAYKMAQLAKAVGCITIASSSDSTDHHKEYLAQGFDYVILGEAEYTLLNLVQSLDSENSTSNITGLVYNTKDGLVNTGKRPVINDLDSLPFPAWDLIDVESYRKAWLEKNGYFSINFATTRGCPYKCNWCAKPIYGNRYNARTPQNVFEEIKQLYEKYHFDHIWFCDDIFGLKPGWVKEFATLLHQSNIKIRFKIQSRADLLLKDEQVKPLADAGCATVWMGAESGSQKILDGMDKGITVAQIEEATAQLKQNGIRTAFFLQFGYLEETKEDIVMTLEMLRKLMPDEIGISVSYPLPGTKFYEKVKEELKTKTNWTDSDEMAIMFRGTYEPAFYKKLHRYVHTYYRRLQNDKKVKQFQIKAIIKMPLYAFQEVRQKQILK